MIEDIFFPLFCDLCALTQEARVSDQSYRSIIHMIHFILHDTGDQRSAQRENATRIRQSDATYFIIHCIVIIQCYYMLYMSEYKEVSTGMRRC